MHPLWCTAGEGEGFGAAPAGEGCVWETGACPWQEEECIATLHTTTALVQGGPV